jgi:calmodulin
LQSKHTLTEQEDAECRECFNLFDRDKDGKISISELGLIMRSLGRAPTELEVKDYMKSIDKGSGAFDIGGLLDVRPDPFPHSHVFILLNFCIQVMARSWKSLQEEEEAILNAFKVFDKDNTGKIDAEELRHIFVTLGDALTQEEVNESLKLANIDSNGKIDYREFAKVLLPQPLPRR